MKIEIKTKFGDAIFKGNFDCIADAVKSALAAKKSLRFADLSSANLRSANLRSADLRSANLSFANLRSADLRSADLRSADLSSANLRSANLSFADLRSANLRSADLSFADLSSANLRSANLSFADLSSADLSSANLRSADLRSAKNASLAIAQIRILPDGDIIGWKKLRDNVIAKILIPTNARRSNAFGRKCRCEFAHVIELSVNGNPLDGEGMSLHSWGFMYKVGETVKPDSFNPNWTNECSSGIHFFITREEAEAYKE